MATRMTVDFALIGTGVLGLAALPAMTTSRLGIAERLGFKSTARPSAQPTPQSPAYADSLDAELQALLAVLPLLLRGGLSPIKALEWCASRARGDLGVALIRGLAEVSLGQSEERVLADLADRLQTPSMREFSVKVRSALHRGNRLAEMLQSQAVGIEGRMRAARIAAAAKAESRMMVPLVFVILPVTIGVALLPSIAAISQLA